MRALVLILFGLLVAGCASTILMLPVERSWIVTYGSVVGTRQFARWPEQDI